MAVDALFPDGFVWGAATAAYQIEGALAEGGRGPSIWDAFSHAPGNVRSGDTGDVACDHYHRYAEDVALMRELGLGAYRFSVAWPRIFPAGAGAPNREGLDFYKRLVDALLEADIQPYVTLYHWDLPQALQDRGGWEHPDTVKRFGEYAYTLAGALGGGVHDWITHNEPWVAAFLGNLLGIHAPGKRDLGASLRVAHHLLLSHAEATEALRAEGAPGDRVGIALNLSPVEPASDSSEDAEAAQLQDGFLNRWFLDPLFKGAYPADMLESFGEHVPEIDAAELARVAAPLDFLGVNYYTRSVVRHDPARPLLPVAQVSPDGRRYTAMGWEVYPRGLSELLARVHADYAPRAQYVTENGAAFPDELRDGEVDDPLREEYLRDHLTECYRAVEEGVPLRGYFAWSLLDNFEWAEGYGKRFGLVHVDYATQARTLKRSGRWYAGVTRENGLEA